ncbi:MAG: alpha/beta hydrolase [Ilumatobacteraceae bacterium]
MIDIGGHPTWVDDRGAGDETVVLLHGGMSHSGLLLDAFGGALTARHRVVSYDRRGLGRTSDTTGPFHYADMATETIGVLESVVGGPAHLVGWSDGGIIALLVALRRPDLVERMVVIGTNVHHDALLPVDVDPGGPFATRIYEDYAALSPDGADHFGNISDRFEVMVTTEPTMSPGDLGAITAPTLVMVGDDDFFPLDHTCAIYSALPAGRLAVVPGASHALPLEQPALVATLIVDFLASDEPPPTLLPVRRAD